MARYSTHIAPHPNPDVVRRNVGPPPHVVLFHKGGSVDNLAQHVGKDQQHQSQGEAVGTGRGGGIGGGVEAMVILSENKKHLLRMS